MESQEKILIINGNIYRFIIRKHSIFTENNLVGRSFSRSRNNTAEPSTEIVKIGHSWKTQIIQTTALLKTAAILGKVMKY